uniref:Uncharacterized protein n=1 Tax=Caenorhabditis tropicalis TaxID=1561998 RepID=A0A1I7UBY0_9PELO
MIKNSLNTITDENITEPRTSLLHYVFVLCTFDNQSQSRGLSGQSPRYQKIKRFKEQMYSSVGPNIASITITTYA